jgi:hypothetical protein
LFTAHVGGGSSLLSCGVFLPPPLSQAFPLLVGGRTTPLPLEPLQPALACLFTVPGRIPPFGLRVPHPLCHMSLLFLLLFYSVSLYSLGGGQSVQGAMLIWPRVVCGSTVYRLAHFVHIFPSHLCTGHWRPGGPPGFSI